VDRTSGIARGLAMAASALLVAACGAPASPVQSSSAGVTASASTAAPSPSTAIPSASAAITGLTGHILFSRAGGTYGEDTLFVINADGSNEIRLSDYDRGAGPMATRDGSTIAFATYGPETQNRGTVAITDLDGSPRTILPLPAGTINLGMGPFSPDGKRILREGWDDNHPDVAGVYVTNVDGSGLVRLTQRAFIPGDWSPDGKQILLFDGDQGEPPPPGQLYVARADGTHVTQLTPTSTLVGCCGNYRYSPDGSKVLFATQDGGIWTIGPDGSNLTQVFDNPSGRWAIFPAWSPDGSMILFGMDPIPNLFAHPHNEVYVIRSDGTGLTLVLGGNDFKREFLWIG
jgi:Tol biopolymer transport system component